MITFVGTQKDYSNALRQLVELEYEAIEAYEAAINRIEDTEYKKGLVNAKNDHEEHIAKLSKILESKNIEVPHGPGGAQLITIGKVAIANIFGDQAILKAMIQVEDNAEIAYKRMDEHENKFPEVDSVLKSSLADEKRHITWLKTITE